MSDAGSKEPSGGRSLALPAALALVLAGAMVTLFVVLTRSSGAGRAAIERSVTAVQEGDDGALVKVAGEEAESIRQAFLDARSFSISNFQSQRGTSCFWVKLHQRGRDVDARFVLAERGDTAEVIAVSLARGCQCPTDIDRPCHLE